MIPRIIPDRDNTRKWYLDEDFYMELEEGHAVHIRKGYRFDGHSVPFIFRWLFPKYHETDIVGALVHDYLGDTMPWHRFNQQYRDRQYRYVMSFYASGLRLIWMPRAVFLWGFIRTFGWSDKRGDVKPRTVIDVRVEHHGL